MYAVDSVLYLALKGTIKSAKFLIYELQNDMFSRSHHYQLFLVQVCCTLLGVGHESFHVLLTVKQSLLEEREAQKFKTFKNALSNLHPTYWKHYLFEEYFILE